MQPQFSWMLHSCITKHFDEIGNYCYNWAQTKEALFCCFMEGHWERRELLKFKEGAWGRTWNKLISQSPSPALCTSCHPFLYQCLLHLGKPSPCCQILSGELVQSWAFFGCLLVSGITAGLGGALPALSHQKGPTALSQPLLHLCHCKHSSGSLGRGAAPRCAHLSSAWAGVLHKAALPSVEFHLCHCSQCKQSGRERWY